MYLASYEHEHELQEFPIFLLEASSLMDGTTKNDLVHDHYLFMDSINKEKAISGMTEVGGSQNLFQEDEFLSRFLPAQQMADQLENRQVGITLKANKVTELHRSTKLDGNTGLMTLNQAIYWLRDLEFSILCANECITVRL